MEHWIEESTYQLLDTSYLADVTFHLGIPTNELDKVQNSLINLTSGQVKFEIGDEIYVDLPINA